MKRLLRALFVWKVAPTSPDTFKTACAIVTQSTGRKRDRKTPARGNFLLAEVTHKLWEETGLPVLPQIEVEWAEKIWRANPFPSAYTANQTDDGTSGMEWNTYVVAKLQKDWLENNGKDLRVILVASPLHLGRCKWVYERLGFTVFVPQIPSERYFDEKQDQWWLRCIAGVWFYELLARIFFLLKGWM